MLLPFAPPVLLLLSICFAEVAYSSIVPRLAIYTVIAACALTSIFNPPFGNALLNYSNGFFSSWYIIWSANLIFIHSPNQVKRLRKSPPSAKGTYHWESVPPLGYYRLLWALDLTTNFRGIDWEHAAPKGGYPQLKEGQSSGESDPSLRQCIAKQVGRMLVAYTAVDLSHHFLLIWKFESIMVIPAEIIGTALFIFAIIDGLHALSTLIGVGLLYHEPRSYPSLFGRLTDLQRLRLKDIWSKLWHNLFKNGFLTTAQSLVPPGPPTLLVCFVLSSLVHASASYAGSLDVRSTMWTLAFFCAQPVGVVLQGLLEAWIKGALGGSKAGPHVGVILHVANLVIGLVLIYNTFPWGVRDVAVQESIRSISLPWSVVDFIWG